MNGQLKVQFRQERRAVSASWLLLASLQFALVGTSATMMLRNYATGCAVSGSWAIRERTKTMSTFVTAPLRVTRKNRRILRKGCIGGLVATPRYFPATHGVPIEANLLLSSSSFPTNCSEDYSGTSDGRRKPAGATEKQARAMGKTDRRRRNAPRAKQKIFRGEQNSPRAKDNAPGAKAKASWADAKSNRGKVKSTRRKGMQSEGNVLKEKVDGQYGVIQDGKTTPHTSHNECFHDLNSLSRGGRNLPYGRDAEGSVVTRGPVSTSQPPRLSLLSSFCDDLDRGKMSRKGGFIAGRKNTRDRIATDPAPTGGTRDAAAPLLSPLFSSFFDDLERDMTQSRKDDGGVESERKKPPNSVDNCPGTTAGERVSDAYGSSSRSLSSFFDDINEKMRKREDGLDANLKAASSKRDIENDSRVTHETPPMFSDLHHTHGTRGGDGNRFLSSPLLPLPGDEVGSEMGSIFDRFPLPKPPAPPSPNSYHRETFREYRKELQELIASPKFQKGSKKRREEDFQAASEWLFREERVLKYHFPTLLEHGGTERHQQDPPLCSVTDVSGQRNERHTTGLDTKPEIDVSKLTYRELQRHCKERNIPAVGKTAILRKRLSDSLSNVKLLAEESPRNEFHSFRERFLGELKTQEARFLKESGLTKDQRTRAMQILAILGDRCAKNNLIAPLEIAWEKIKEAGMVLREQNLNTYLYVVGMAAGSVSGIVFGLGRIGGGSLLSNLDGSILDLDDASNGSGIRNAGGLLPPISPTGEYGVEGDVKPIDLPGEVATFHDLLFQPTEKSISLRVKSFVSKGDTKGAEALLDALPGNADGSELKLRTYLPVFKAYCDDGDCEKALKLFTRMKKSPGVHLEPENYVLLLSTLAQQGYFRVDSKPIEGAQEWGYVASSGPALFDLLAKDMADDVLEITSASARRLHNAIVTAYSNEMTTAGMNLEQIPSLTVMRPNNDKAKDHELVISRVTIDNSTAICPRTGAKLRLITLNKNERREFREDLLQLADTQFHEFNINSKESGDVAMQELNRFADWLDEREGGPFTAIIDGANVAYFGQNFEGGKFNCYQILFLVEALESNGENPLVVVPHKYSGKSFTTFIGSKPKRQIMDEEELRILQGLNETGRLYTVPPKCLDDYYWMLASVSDQVRARNGQNIDVPADNKEGRFPGTRPMLLSNDQMRDHRLELLDPRLFQRWTSSHIVNYNFTAFYDSECVDQDIVFSAPDFFSREIQGNPCRNEDGSDGGNAWHFPVNDWDLNERFCIRIPVCMKFSG